MFGTLAYVLPLLIAGAASAGLALYSWRQVAVRGAGALAALALAVAWWTCGYMLELTAPELPEKVLWAKLQYAGIVAAPVAWLVFASYYTGRSSWLSWRNGLLLLAGPALTFALVLTNEAHHLVWRPDYHVAVGQIASLDVRYGPWFWLHTTYAYLAMVLGSLLLVLRALDVSRLYRRQIVALLIGATVPWIGNVLYLTRTPPFDTLDPTPFAFTLSCLALGWALFHDRLLDMVPIARDAVVAGMRDGVVVLDVGGRVVDMNPAAEQIFGQRAGQVVGQAAAQLFARHPALASLVAEEGEWQTTIAVGGEPRSYYDVRVGRFTDSRGRATGRLVIVRDITGRRRDEEIKRFLLAEQATIQKVARAINSTLRLDEVFQTVVRQIHEAFGYEMVSIYLCEGEGLRLQDYLGYEQVMPFIRLDQAVAGRVARTGEAAFVRDIDDDPDFIVVRPGTRQAIVAPLKVREGRVLGVLLVEATEAKELGDDDFTLLKLLADQISVAVVNARLFDELRGAKAAAEEATRVRSAFLAQLSHEVRTPLNGVVGVAELLLRAELTPEQRTLVEIARTSSRTLLEMFNNTLDYARIEARRLELARTRFSLEDCLEAAIDHVALPAASKRIELSYRVSPGVPAALVGDGVRLRQILVNLLSNAVKFTDRGSVTVRVMVAPQSTTNGREAAPADRHPAVIQFEVADTGIGIAPEQLGRLFRPFSQIESGAARLQSGAGLGLAISKRLVTLMGGSMEAESDGRSGSIFRFTIVAEAAPEVPGPPADPIAGARVLVVEREGPARESLLAQLDAWGAAARAAGSPEQSEALLRAETFDVGIVGDPAGAGGASAAASLRAATEGASIPLLRLAWLGSYGEEDAASGGLFCGTLYRPITGRRLRAALEDALGVTEAAVGGPESSGDGPAEEDAPPLRILVADDDPVTRQLLRQLLRVLGHDADLAVDGQEALQAIERQSYDLLLLDVRMPELDGLTLARLVRERLPAERQPYILVVTGDAPQENRERYRAAAVDDVLGKPVWLQDLGAALGHFHAARPRTGRAAAAEAEGGVRAVGEGCPPCRRCWRRWLTRSWRTRRSCWSGCGARRRPPTCTSWRAPRTASSPALLCSARTTWRRGSKGSSSGRARASRSTQPRRCRRSRRCSRRCRPRCMQRAGPSRSDREG